VLKSTGHAPKFRGNKKKLNQREESEKGTRMRERERDL
jgi:hypothetical protein